MTLSENRYPLFRVMLWITHQLTVTHRGAGPEARGHPPIGWKTGSPRFNGVEIKESDVTLAEEELAPSLQQMDPAARKDNVLGFLIDLQIVAKAAEDKKIENTDDFKKRLAFTRKRLMMDSLLAAEGKAANTEEAMKKVYEEASKQITGEVEVRARHILVETEDEAKAGVEELKKGADFAELAKKKSKDPGA